MRSIKKMFVGSLLLVAACAPAENPQIKGAGSAVLFEGARLIAGDGSAPIEDSAFLVEGNTFTAIGRKGTLKAPDGAVRVDLTGKTVMPTLIDLHTHLGYTNVKEMNTSAANYTRQNLVDHLNRFAYYGIGATLSMGADGGELPFQLREETIPDAALFRTAGRGIATPNGGPQTDYSMKVPYGVTTEDEARKAVRELAAKKVDIVKIWVDDRNGKVKTLTPELYRAIIDEAHKNNLRVAAHIFALADAKELLRAGLDGFAHGVRDRDIDDEFVALIKQHSNVFLIPNLPDRGAMEDAGWLSETVPAAEIERLRDSIARRTPDAQQRARESFDVQARNLTKLHAAGVKVAFGTDAGDSIGWATHTELADMVAAGLTPAQVIVAATSTSAEVLKLDALGTVAPGKRASFMVLDANPLNDITNTRRIASVYLNGKAVDRAALRAAWSSRATN